MKGTLNYLAKGNVIGKREFHLLASTKLEARALKAASRPLAGRSFDSLKTQNRGKEIADLQGE